MSLDGFRPESHGRFRGDRQSFHRTVATVRQFASAGLLQGLLCTPNSLADDEEYRELCEFAADQGAGYVLLNPLSSMGRGVKAQKRLAASEGRMRHINELTAPFEAGGLDVVHIRFPSTGQPLAGLPGRHHHLRVHRRRRNRLPVPGLRGQDAAVRSMTRPSSSPGTSSLTPT